MSDYNIKQFNEKVRVMNQSNSKQLTLTAAEARNLHTEIFALLEKIKTLSDRVLTQSAQEDLIKSELDGGRWD